MEGLDSTATEPLSEVQLYVQLLVVVNLIDQHKISQVRVCHVRPVS